MSDESSGGDVSSKPQSQPRQLEGRVALVTGAAQGIGFSIARHLAQCGAAVAALDCDAESLAIASKRLHALGARFVSIVADVTSRPDIERAVQLTQDRLGPIQMLVNNAGVWVIKPLMEHSDAEWDRVVGVNLKGTFICSTAVLPQMIQRREGVIVNITSIAAAHYTNPHASYAAAKAGVAALTRDLAYETARSGVRVNAIAPGSIPREPPESAGPVLGWGEAQDIAHAVRFLVSDEAKYITGTTLTVAGGADLALNYGTAHASGAGH